MKRYFKYEEDPGAPLEHNWIEWTEWEGEWNTRQVQWYYNRWLSSVDEYWPGLGRSLSDQPLSRSTDGEAQEISAQEFERVWHEALMHRADHE